MVLTRDDFNTAITLRVLIGTEAGVRLSVAQVKGRAFREWQSLGRNADGEAWIVAQLDSAKARGRIEEAPGPRGGKGYALTPAGAEWIAQALAWKSPATKRAEAQAEKVRQRRAQLEREYHALIDGPDGGRMVTVRALDISEAVKISDYHASRHKRERITAVWESDAVPHASSPPQPPNEPELPKGVAIEGERRRA